MSAALPYFGLLAAILNAFLAGVYAYGFGKSNDENRFAIYWLALSVLTIVAAWISGFSAAGGTLSNG